VFRPPFAAQFFIRRATLEQSPEFVLLNRLRDYEIHTGNHGTVLVLSDKSGQLRGSVCLDLTPVRLELQADRQKFRRRHAKRDAIDALLGVIEALKDEADVRVLVGRCYADVGGLLKWLRKALLELSREFNRRPLTSW